jgi:hypothetical protein
MTDSIFCSHNVFVFPHIQQQQLLFVQAEIGGMVQQGASPRDAFEGKKKRWVTKLKEHCFVSSNHATPCPVHI